VAYSELLDHHIRSTEARFDKVDDKLDSITTSITDLNKFKIEMLYQSRTISLLMGGACGLVSMIVSSVLTVIITNKLGK